MTIEVLAFWASARPDLAQEIPEPAQEESKALDLIKAEMPEIAPEVCKIPEPWPEL